MEKEIKEILKYLKIMSSENEPDIEITREETKLLLDYITNLQEENKRIFSKVNDDELLISNAMNYAEAQDYKSRCEKANWWLKEMLKQARSDETKAVINGTLELLLNGGENNVKD